MTVRRGAPAFGASHGRAASLDRRFQPVRSKPYRSSTIWARPRLAASVQRSGRCGRDGPDSRSGRSCPRLINPGRFDKIFRAARLEHVDQEPAGQLSCDGFAPGHLRTSTVRSHGRLNLVARKSGKEEAARNAVPHEHHDLRAGERQERTDDARTAISRESADNLDPKHVERTAGASRKISAGRSCARRAGTIRRDKRKARLFSRAFASRISGKA
ncbi:hypothetical protein ACVIW2_000710 [Bradyrhizobium huanghuaihaiense]